MGYDTDRTFSAQQWRVVVFAACGVLIAGIGLGVLVGSVTKGPPDPPAASASILPDMLPSSAPDAAVPSASADEEMDEPTLPPPVVATPPPVAVKAAPPPAPVAIAPKPERSASPRHVEAKAKPASAEPGRPASGPRWVVQLGAFQSSDHAHLLVNTLAAHGQTAQVTFIRNAAGQGWFYVQSPPYRSAAAAKNAARSLAAREHLPTYLVKLPDAH
jgi:cell division protein FtsN